MFIIIPKMAAMERPLTEIVLKTFMESIPTPVTRIIAVITRFFVFAKSTLFSPKILRPIELIIPKRIIETPPITGSGIH